MNGTMSCIILSSAHHKLIKLFSWVNHQPLTDHWAFILSKKTLLFFMTTHHFHQYPRKRLYIPGIMCRVCTCIWEGSKTMSLDGYRIRLHRSQSPVASRRVYCSDPCRDKCFWQPIDMTAVLATLIKYTYWHTDYLLALRLQFYASIISLLQNTAQVLL